MMKTAKIRSLTAEQLGIPAPPVPNARFWYYLNGTMTKITLRPGQELSHCAGGPCDEGNSYSGHTFRHDGDRVTCIWSSWGRDCDGRYSDGGESMAPLNQLAVRALDFTEAAGLLVPEWQAGDAWQRDYSAEAAGY